MPHQYSLEIITVTNPDETLERLHKRLMELRAIQSSLINTIKEEQGDHNMAFVMRMIPSDPRYMKVMGEIKLCNESIDQYLENQDV